MLTQMRGEMDTALPSTLDTRLEGDEVEADNIYTIALVCKHAFEEYVRSPRLFHQQIAELQRRFLTWAGYLGVFASVNICLDARLVASPEMKDLFMSMLNILRRNLERGIRRHQIPTDRQNIDNSSLTEDGAVRGITGAIDRLSRLALIVRASGKRDEVERVLRWTQNQEPSGFSEVILAMVKHRFSSEQFEMPESLQIQLASSIVYRRNRLLYQARHEMKLRTDRGDDAYSESAPTAIQGSTLQRALQTVREDKPGVLHSKRPQSSQNVGVLAPSLSHTSAYIRAQRSRITRSDADSTYSVNPHVAAKYPKRPQTQICDLCGKIQPREVLTDEHQWRSHVNEDLKPYVCVSSDCGNLPPAFAHRREWRNHMNSEHGLEWPRQIHRPSSWYCPLEDSTILSFTNEQECLQHMHSMHSRNLSHNEILLLCSRSKLPELLDAHICPFCCESVVPSPGPTNPVTDSKLPAVSDPLKQRRSTVHFKQLEIAAGSRVEGHQSPMSGASVQALRPVQPAEDTENTGLASAPVSKAGGSHTREESTPAEPGDSASAMPLPPADTSTDELSNTGDPIQVDLLRERMSKHVADHLESVALWSLLWHGDNSSTTSGASAKPTRDSEFGSVGDHTEIEASEVDQTEIPECLPFDWSIVAPSLSYNETIQKDRTSQAEEATFPESNETLGVKIEAELAQTEQTKVPVGVSLNHSPTTSITHHDSIQENARPGALDSALSEYSRSLGDELREAYCVTDSKERNEFLPIDALDRIITEGRVEKEFGNAPKSFEAKRGRDMQDILGTSEMSGLTTSRKKIFAILALIDKHKALWDFISEGIDDRHLPLQKEMAQSSDGSRKVHFEPLIRSAIGEATLLPIGFFGGWTGAEIDNFERTQWKVLVPYFSLATEKDRPCHYTFYESAILPFLEDDEVKQSGKMGGLAHLWRVKIHPSHHNQGVLASGQRGNPSFAIRRLGHMDKYAFLKELENLKSFSTHKFLHLITLLGSFEWRQQYYLIFPWADGNLKDFWQGHSGPLARKRDISTTLWFSEQCLGLVEGLKMIHGWEKPDVAEQNQMSSSPTTQIHGLHGDLKPENILWFKQRNKSSEQNSSPLGHFKISDFGLSYFHGSLSIGKIDARGTAFSPTYRAPERGIKSTVTLNYDVWSLACILLEFASWYLGGYEEVRTFAQRRVNEDEPFEAGYRQDRFFNFKKVSASRVSSDGFELGALIFAVQKISVAEEFERLYDNPHCSDYLVDLLELIRTGLLRLGPENRKSCVELAEILQRLHESLQKDPYYGITRNKHPPHRPASLDSFLMEEEITSELKEKIRDALPRRPLNRQNRLDRKHPPTALSFHDLSADAWDTPAPPIFPAWNAEAYLSTESLEEGLASTRFSMEAQASTSRSPQLLPSHMNPEPSTAGHSRPPSPEGLGLVSAEQRSMLNFSTSLPEGFPNYMNSEPSAVRHSPPPSLGRISFGSAFEGPSTAQVSRPSSPDRKSNSRWSRFLSRYRNRRRSPTGTDRTGE